MQFLDKNIQILKFISFSLIVVDNFMLLTDKSVTSVYFVSFSTDDSFVIVSLINVIITLFNLFLFIVK